MVCSVVVGPNTQSSSSSVWSSVVIVNVSFSMPRSNMSVSSNWFCSCMLVQWTHSQPSQHSDHFLLQLHQSVEHPVVHLQPFRRASTRWWMVWMFSTVSHTRICKLLTIFQPNCCQSEVGVNKIRVRTKPCWSMFQWWTIIYTMSLRRLKFGVCTSHGNDVYVVVLEKGYRRTQLDLWILHSRLNMFHTHNFVRYKCFRCI